MFGYKLTGYTVLVLSRTVKYGNKWITFKSITNWLEESSLQLGSVRGKSEF